MVGSWIIATIRFRFGCPPYPSADRAADQPGYRLGRGSLARLVPAERAQNRRLAPLDPRAELGRGEDGERVVGRGPSSIRQSQPANSVPFVQQRVTICAIP